MASKIFVRGLKVGMFVADLDRPWVDTTFLLQGFLVENDEQIVALRTHCEYVMVDRARSTGAEFEAVSGISPATNTMPPMRGLRMMPGAAEGDPDAVTPLSSAEDREARKPAKRQRSAFDRGDAPPRASGGAMPAAGPRGLASSPGEPGAVGRLLASLKRLFGKPRAKPSVSLPEAPRETPQEFAARAELLPPGIEVQTYVEQVSVEEEVPRAQAAVTKASTLLEKLVNDIRLGQSFEIDRVEEIVEGMVESIVRNPDAAMWIARLREEDISTYGHGLQVSVYLASFGRHVGFPKAQLSQLAQIGRLLVRSAEEPHRLGRGFLPRAPGTAVRVVDRSLPGGLAHRAFDWRGRDRGRAQPRAAAEAARAGGHRPRQDALAAPGDARPPLRHQERRRRDGFHQARPPRRGLRPGPQGFLPGLTA